VKTRACPRCGKPQTYVEWVSKGPRMKSYWRHGWRTSCVKQEGGPKVPIAQVWKFREGDHVSVEGTVMADQSAADVTVVIGDGAAIAFAGEHVKLLYHKYKPGDEVWDEIADRGGVVRAVSPDDKLLWVEIGGGQRFVTLDAANVSHAGKGSKL
jgi:hypothetical protein